MRRRAEVRGPVLGGIVIGALFVALAATSVLATHFEYGSAKIGDRRIQLSWRPDAAIGDTLIGDPVSSGNTILKLQQIYSGIHNPGDAVRAMVVNATGSEVFSAADGEPVRRWRTFGADHPDSVWSLALGGLPAPRSLSLHGSGQYLLGGLPDGEIAMWDIRAIGSPPLIHRLISSQLGVAVLNLDFYPSVRDTTDLRFAAVDADSLVTIWEGWDALNNPPAKFQLKVPGGATGAMALSSDLSVLAVGTSKRVDDQGHWVDGGVVRIWDLRGNQPQLTYLLGQNGDHTGPINYIAISRDQKKLVSADANGVICVWRLADGTRLLRYNVLGRNVQPLVDLMAPSGRMVFAVLPDGTVELDSGDDGTHFQSSNVIGDPNVGVTSMAQTPDGSYLILGRTDGKVQLVEVGFCRPSLEEPRCFGGYMVWRSLTPDASDASLLRVYNYSDSTWTFDLDPRYKGVRTFSDPDSVLRRKQPPIPPTSGSTPIAPVVIAGPTNGVPYYYSITRFDLISLGGSVFTKLVNSIQDGFYKADSLATAPTVLKSQAPARTGLPLLKNVRVVPNPYEAGKEPWELPGETHVEFQNLPSRATIRIYTLSGERVRVLAHAPSPGLDADVEPWDLKNERGSHVTSGVYVYQVETPSGEKVQGFFVVVL